VRGKTGGKAWFGGLACSGLAGYRASRAWGNACVRHFYPLCVVDNAIIPRVTDKLLGVFIKIVLLSTLWATKGALCLIRKI
jgi:hypothetical protein